MTTASRPTGLFAALRALGETLISTAHERIELFSVELQEEKYRFIQLLVWIGATIFSAAMVLTFGSLVLVYLFWDSARLAVLAGLTGFYVLAFGVIIAAFRRYLARQPKPFAGTLEEIREDEACIHNPN